MPSRKSCPCLLCATEIELLRNLQASENKIIEVLFPAYPQLFRFTSTTELLRHLRNAPPDGTSDRVLSELIAARKVRPDWIEGLLILVFLPMLHGTIRRVTSVQSALTAEDITQQVLSLFLEVLDSSDLSSRETHFAFAISRSVKRKTFEWAHRQSLIEGLRPVGDDEMQRAAASAESLERQAMLRHFLSTAVARQLLTYNEIDLLIEFKLEGNGGEDFEASGRGNSNMLRQRLKRLLAKLRRLAAHPQSSARPSL